MKFLLKVLRIVSAFVMKKGFAFNETTIKLKRNNNKTGFILVMV
jgi:hypothetical protein